jgi:3,4-dihydroxy 2-butanone 4-phosphate synthase/GTP cyclohydrolase II
MTQNILQSLQGNGQNKLDVIFKQLIDNKYACMLFINNIDEIKSVEFLNEIKPNSQVYSTPTMDEKDFGIGAQILHQLKIQKLSILSNSDQIKRVGLAGYGLEIVEYVGY